MSAQIEKHPAFRRMPPCQWPLVTDEAKKEYDVLGRVLFQRGKLTVDKHRALSAYALQFDQMQLKIAAGKPVRDIGFHLMARERRSLGLDSLDDPIAEPEDAPENPYAEHGWACRR